MTVTYYPRGVCSRQMDVTVESGIITDAKVIGGCSGNLQGITRLIRGMDAEEAIARMRGIRCGAKSTSCPDQLSFAIERALNEDRKNAENN